MSDILDDRATRIVTFPFPLPIRRKSRAATCPGLPLLVALLCAWLAPQAQAAARKPARPALPPAADFERLSGSRAAACAAPGTGPADAALAAMGEPILRRCAWSQHLEMRYWQTLPDAGNTCLPAAATAWHRLGAGAGATPPPWNATWTGQAMFMHDKDRQQAGAVWRRADGQWSAVLWRWQPSTRLATRNWQAGQWNTVVEAMKAIGAGSPATTPSPLLAAWQDASKGKPRLLAGDAARWASFGACLTLRTARIGQSQLHLPYSRDDARLEQRSAMQVQLARRYPEAEWLRPFALLDPATPGARSGAKFFAVWKEGTAVQGQLWITLRDEAGIVRARIGSELPAASQSGAPVKARVALVERELAALAHAWEARHE